MILESFDKEILFKFLQNQASVDEQRMILLWLKESPKNRKYLDRLIWECTKAGHQWSDTSWVNSDFSKIKHSSKATSSLYRYWMMYAASFAGVVLLMALAVVGYSKFTAESFVTEVVAKGQKKQILLDDGTKVLLAPDTKFSYPTAFKGSQRLVQLDGEAFFEVAHDSAKPFVVKTLNSEITVLGTKFNVKAYHVDKVMNAVLVEGKVSVALIDETQNIQIAKEVLSPSQKLTFIRHEDSYYIENVNIDEELAWQKNRIVFNNESFGDIAVSLERAYDVVIHIGSENLIKKRFTGEFYGESIEEVLRTFEEWTDIQYVMKDSVVYINQLPM